MEVAWFSDTFLSYYITTGHHNSEEHNLKLHRPENLKQRRVRNVHTLRPSLDIFKLTMKKIYSFAVKRTWSRSSNMSLLVQVDANLVCILSHLSVNIYFKFIHAKV
jgi:hypothetical protein